MATAKTKTTEPATEPAHGPQSDPGGDQTVPDADHQAVRLDPGLTYEQARDQLIDVVNRLESGGESLAGSMELFRRGQALAGLCEQFLTDARATVEAAKTEDSSATGA